MARLLFFSYVMLILESKYIFIELILLGYVVT